MTLLSGLSPRDRRAVAVGLATVILAVSYRVAIPAAAALSRWRVANQAASDRLAIAREALLGARTLEDSLRARARRLVAADSALLSSGSPARVASELGSIVRASARSAGLELLGATTQSDSLARDGFRHATARVEAQGDVSGLMQFLLLVELAPGLLDVRDLAITPAEPAASNDRAEVLRISLTVAGVALAVSPIQQGGVR